MMNKHFCLLPLTILFLGKTHHLSIGKHDFANLLASKLKSFLQKFSFNSSDNDKWIEIMSKKFCPFYIANCYTKMDKTSRTYVQYKVLFVLFPLHMVLL